MKILLIIVLTNYSHEYFSFYLNTKCLRTVFVTQHSVRALLPGGVIGGNLIATNAVRGSPLDPSGGR